MRQLNKTWTSSSLVVLFQWLGEDDHVAKRATANGEGTPAQTIAFGGHYPAKSASPFSVVRIARRRPPSDAG